MKYKRIILLLIPLIATACASSYHDREDALNSLGSTNNSEAAPTPKPAEQETQVEETQDVKSDEQVDSVVNLETVSKRDLPLTGACIINADCAEGKYCDLGICESDCLNSADCSSGYICSDRGKCVSDNSYVDYDTGIKLSPPVNWNVDKTIVRLDAGETSGSFDVKVSGSVPLEYRIQIEPESMRGAVTISQSKGIVFGNGSKKITVTLDREALGNGDHEITASIITNAGQKNIVYELSNGFNGRYAGFISYTDPGIGRVPIVIDITVDDNGNVLGRIVTTASLLFPEERTITGLLEKNTKKLVLNSADLMRAGQKHDPFQRDIGKELNISASINEYRSISGEIEELIYGLMPYSLTVTGEINLIRISADEAKLTKLSEPVLPVFPTILTSYTNCAGFAGLKDKSGLTVNCGDTDTDGNGSIDLGGEIAFGSNMIECSELARAKSFKLDNVFEGVDTSAKPIVDFGLVESCKSDESQSPNQTGSCVNISELLCLHKDQQNYLMKGVAKSDEYKSYFETNKNLQRLYSFIANDLLTDAYRTSVQEVSSPLTTELSRLEKALEEYEKAEQVFFNVANVSLISHSGSGVVSADNYDLFRVPLQYIRSSQSALQRYVNLSMRKNFSRDDLRDALRTQVQNNARIIFYEGILLAHLIKTSGGSFQYELSQISDELQSVSRVMNNVDGGMNPMGYPNDYVPFIYDPANAGKPTNFFQLADMAGSSVDSAVRKAEAADNTTKTMQVRTEEIKNRISDIRLNYESEIMRICGANNVLLLDQCGIVGGELLLAYNKIAEQYSEIEKTHQQMMDVYQMVKIKNDTALQVMKIKDRTLKFMESSGIEIEAMEMAQAEIRAIALEDQGLFGALGGFISGFTSIATGVASAFASQNPYGAVGGVAGGMGGIVNAVMGASAAARSADQIRMGAKLEQRATRLKNLQQLRYQKEGMEIAEVQAAETVKILLIQMAQLNYDLDLAEMRLGDYVIQAANLRERVDFLKHQHDVLLTQSLESVNNPLSNLSFRIERDHAVLLAVENFENAISDVYLAARSLEHELNVELPQIESQLFQVNSAYQLKDFLTCLGGWHDDYALAFGSAHEEVLRLSLREDVLGFTKSVYDEVSGEEIRPQELFRRVLFNPKNITQTGHVEFPFVTSIAGSTKQFSNLVCNDRIKSVKVMLVGDGLGDNEATVKLKQEGNSYLRDCTSDPDKNNDILNIYHLDDRSALIQAGVNSFGLASPNYELTGRSVASDRWLLIIPTVSSAPNNADVNLLTLDDVIIEITHEARTLREGSASSVFGRCSI